MGIETRHLNLAPERSIHRSFFIRVGTFISFTLLMLAATIYQAFTKTQLDPNADMLFACVAPLAFFCFASQPDVLRTWGVPTSVAEWKRLGRRRHGRGEAAARKDSGETIRLTGNLDWADFLGSTSPDTIYSIDSRLSEMEEKERVRVGGGSKRRGLLGSTVGELAPWSGDRLERLDTVSEEERERNSRSARSDRHSLEGWGQSAKRMEWTQRGERGGK